MGGAGREQETRQQAVKRGGELGVGIHLGFGNAGKDERQSFLKNIRAEVTGSGEGALNIERGTSNVEVERRGGGENFGFWILDCGW